MSDAEGEKKCLLDIRILNSIFETKLELDK